MDLRPQGRQYYLHRFYEHQPDLNIANPAVREEIARIVGFWLQLGVSGFRVDAVPFLIELDGIDGAPSIDPHRYLKDLRAFVERRHGDAILLGEVNLPPKDQRAFFGDEDGDELNLVFNFSVMQRIYLALARQRRHTGRAGAGRPARRCRSTRSGPRSCATTTS